MSSRTSSFNGKVIAITGAASGIGRATASVLHSRGASLALSDISADSLATFAAELMSLPTGELEGSSSKASTQKVTHRVVDVSSTEQVNAWFEEILHDFGRLDGAANVAGMMSKPSLIAECSDEDWEKVMSVNIGGVFKCLRAELKHIAEGGAIVNVASGAGLVGFPFLANYVASKHAVIGLTKTAAKEAGSRKVRVNAVAPGYVNTPLLRNAAEAAGGMENAVNLKMVPLERLAEPEEVGKLITWLLSEDSIYVTAEVVRIDGGWLG